MDSKALCLRILDAESERHVYDIVNDVPELLASGNWFPIDGRETNFNVVTNQASTGSKALTELCTNMVDAMLMKHAYLNGVDPLGPAAPRSVIEGVRDLVRLRGARSGILAEVDADSYLKEFAEKNLVIGVTGGRRGGVLPCFTFIDNGEGQCPDKFESTFLSLSAGNKSNVPFVQGKYNMGASGVLTYCGDHWYKLIISRRYDESDDWGWTLVRRRPGGGMPVAEYFKPNGAIPSFPATDLRPMRMQNGERDSRVQCSTGTVVKLYDYQMGSATSFRNIRESINENLVSTILPFRLMDYRQTPDPRRGGVRALGIDERSVNGMEFLLLRQDEADELETSEEERAYEPGQDRDIGGFEHPDLGRISLRAIVLRRNLPGWLARNTFRVFHAVNGQVQFKEHRGYLSQRCKLPGLKDRVVIIVDASNLTEAAHNAVWKADRENIRATRIGQLYRDQVADHITNSQYLKELQQRIAREEMDNLAQESQIALFQNLVEADPSIAQLLPGGMVVTLPGYIGRDSVGEEWQGKYSPTFLELAASSIKANGAEITIDGKRRIEFKTDVVNEYFSRPDNRGRLFTTGMDGKFSHSHALLDGRLTITFATMPDRLAVGEEVTFSLCLLDDAIPEPVTENLTLRVVQARRMPDSGVPGSRRRINPDTEGEEVTTDGRALPPTVWLTRDGRLLPGDTQTERWPELPEEFTDQDGGYVEDFGDDEKKFYINYDNAHFRRVLDIERNDLSKKAIIEQYRVAMLVLMLGFEEAYRRMGTSAVKDIIGEHIDEVRRLTAHGTATVVMSIAKSLPNIINPASVADPDD